ncbi:MAG: hypothetical protein F7B60_03690 [Desulfurococcales archaeon]|nr:hypothetical protein [Desulfurococcales archaeon]
MLATLLLVPFSLKEGITLIDISYGVIGGLLVALGSYGAYKAVEELGGVAAFPLVNLSYIIPMTYGTLVLGESLSTYNSIGLILAAVSILFFAGKPGSLNWKGVLWLIIGFVGFGFTDVALKMYGSHGGAHIASLSFIVNMFVAIYLAVSLRKESLPLERKSNTIFLFLSLLNGILLGISTFSLIKAFSMGPVNKISPIVKLNTVIPVCYSIVRGEQPSTSILTGSVLAIIAVFLLSL